MVHLRRVGRIGEMESAESKYGKYFGVRLLEHTHTFSNV